MLDRLIDVGLVMLDRLMDVGLVLVNGCWIC